MKEVLDASQHSVPSSSMTGVVLGIIAIAVLLVLIVASWRLQRATRTVERQQTDARAHAGQAQHEDSLRRRAEVRAAPAERTDSIGDSHFDE
jgi:type II secretory pathway pseudopilin PulG